MKKAIIIIVILSSIMVLNAQIRETQQRFPLPGEVPEQMKLDIIEDIQLNHKLHSLITNKENRNYIDTTYRHRYSDVFCDVNDWDSAYFVSGYVRDSTHKYYDPDHLTLLALLKIDYQGNILWKRTDSVIRGDHFIPTLNTSIAQLSDGNFFANWLCGE